MKTQLLALLLISYSPFTFSQEWPWFFADATFKQWIKTKQVKCLKQISDDLPYDEIIRRKDYLYFPIQKEITAYYFDENGILEFLRLEEFAIRPQNDTLFTEDIYNDLLLKYVLPYMPLEHAVDSNLLKPYPLSKLFPGMQSYFMHDAVSPDGKVFAEQRLVDTNTLFPYYYWYRLNQEIELQNGEVTTLNQYDLRGDFWDPNMSVTYYEPLNDTISVLIAKAHIMFFEDGTYVPKDTVLHYPYYRKISIDKTTVEYGVRILDSASVYHYYPLKTKVVVETPAKKTEILTTLAGFDGEVSPFMFNREDHYEVRYLTNGTSLTVLNYDRSMEYRGVEKPVYKTIKHVSTFHKKTGEFLKKITYQLNEGKWEIIRVETKTKDGYLQTEYNDRKNRKSINIRVTSDHHENPVFTEHYYTKTKELFRISRDTIYVPGRYIDTYETFLIEYR